MPQPAKPTLVYHADWGSKEEKRWCSRAAPGTDGHYTAFAPEPVRTHPAECYRWFSKDPLGGKRNQDDRKEFGTSLLRWADARSVMLANCLTEDIQSGFPQGAMPSMP